MANIWMHNGFLQVEGQKMSKSLGNFVTINELLTGWQQFSWPGQVIRLALLTTHYRQPIDFTLHALGQAANILSEFAHFADIEEGEEVLPTAEFLEALFDDLNTPRAIAELHRLVGEARMAPKAQVVTSGQPVPVMEDIEVTPNARLAAGLQFLGIDLSTYNRNWMQDGLQSELKSQIRRKVEEMIDARLAARKAKNWAESDRIRDELLAMAIVLKDNKDGTTSWEVKR